MAGDLPVQERATMRVSAALLFLLGVYGVSNAVAMLKVGAPVRWLFRRVPGVRDVVECPVCLSFWLGLAASVWVASPAGGLGLPGWRAPLLDAAAACGFSYVAHTTMEWLCKDLEPPKAGGGEK